FVNILPGTDGLLHISKLDASKRVERVEDYLELGDKVKVRVGGIDRGKLSLDLVEALPGATLPEPGGNGGNGGSEGGGGRGEGRDRGDRRGGGGRGRDRDRDRRGGDRDRNRDRQQSAGGGGGGGGNGAGRRAARSGERTFEHPRCPEDVVTPLAAPAWAGAAGACGGSDRGG